jgi:hypothetical protein
MNNFIVDNNFLVLSKSIKETKPNKETGEIKEYGSISLYCSDTDEFQKVVIFENYQEILDRYVVMDTCRIKIQVQVSNNRTYLKIL